MKIVISTDLKQVDFLDVTLNLDSDKYTPYRKPNDAPLYVHSESNHPPSVLKQIPLSINKRLSDISSTEEEFNKAIPEYQKALSNSGYKHRLAYSEPDNSQKAKRSKKKRQIIWYNPPFCKSVTTNIGHRFLALIKKTFPQGQSIISSHK